MKYILRLITTAFFLLALSSSVNAIGETSNTDAFFYKKYPENPSYGENVYIEIGSYTVDLDRKNIEYYLNGSKIKEGVGEKDISFFLSDKGNENSQTLEIVLDDQTRSFREEIIFYPNKLHLVYEVKNVYNNDNYKGRPPIYSKSEILFKAFPDFYNGGRKIHPDSLYYSWYVDDVKQIENSGLGKKIFESNAKYWPFKKEVSLVVEDYSGKIVNNKKISITAEKTPEVLLYKSDVETDIPFRNYFQNSESVIEDLLDIIAFPLGIFSGNGPSNFSWKINNQKVYSIGGDKTKIKVSNNEKIKGNEVAFEFINSNNTNALQSFKKKFFLNFK